MGFRLGSPSFQFQLSLENIEFAMPVHGGGGYYCYIFDNCLKHRANVNVQSNHHRRAVLSADNTLSGMLHTCSAALSKWSPNDTDGMQELQSCMSARILYQRILTLLPKNSQ